MATDLRINQERFRVLVVSDIHEARENILALQQWVVKRDLSFACIFALGDFANLPPLKVGQRVLQASETEAESKVTAALGNLEAISARVAFVCGNHDPVSCFNFFPNEKDASPNTEVSSLSAFSTNVHGRYIRIAPGLVACGWGGSQDGILNGDVIWDGYPFSKEENKKGLEALLNHFPKEPPASCPVSPDDQVIVLTHSGPSQCGTTLHALDSQHIVFAGDDDLKDCLSSKFAQENCLLNCHGHAHNAYGLAHVFNIPVFNPGPLKDGRFGMIEFFRECNSEVYMDEPVISRTASNLPGADAANSEEKEQQRSKREGWKWVVSGVSFHQLENTDLLQANTTYTQWE
eukprot:GCRY01003154.1.p1 GENE.GCRY01003154.1~~GCRY01003154.1.p1  ORF type:complete len:347 (-),score=71.25 GCRY01003154.1:202-1242(-)